MCSNCNTKIASRRKLCVACYRYQLKHSEPRPLRLIIANRPGPRPLPVLSSPSPSTTKKKQCANCSTLETHQWYRNLCGQGHWCETCKSYYLRHHKVRPPSLFIKAAKRKVDVRSLVSWNQSGEEQVMVPIFTSPVVDSIWIPSGCRPHLYHPRHSNSGCTSPSSVSLPSTPPPLVKEDYAKHSLPSLQRSFTGQEYDAPIFHCL
ncbi:hypothetical protein BC941DRAFT_413598 [Chlamydoabsidia padenii]|nr:hypothetical protein BC941DRAFT_413598 [Chlamydoabsidia padenii]